MRRGKTIVANTLESEESRVAVLDPSGHLLDIYLERMWERQRAGEIYKARVDNVLPGMNAAFLNLGDGRNGFLYLADLGRKPSPGEELVVQVAKTARKGKGARVTPRVSLPGRYVVLVPDGRDVGVSKRVADEEERKRLKELGRQVLPEGFGMIVRTVAEGCGLDEMRCDVEDLMGLWDEISSAARRTAAPCLLYRDGGLLERVLRDELDRDVAEVVLDNPEDLETVTSMCLKFFGPSGGPEVTLYRGRGSVFEVYGVERELELALDKKVWLSSGAYLVIDQAEALTVIDVNTGKYTGAKDLRHTVLKTNLEAAEEVARQLRIRAIGGIVVVDFIDMDSEEDRKILLERLKELFKGDRHRARVFGITPLGLVELTRKRSRSDLRSVLTRGCPMCGSSGFVEREEASAMKLKRAIRKAVGSSSPEAILVAMNPHGARHCLEYLSSWEEEFRCRIFLKEDPSLQWGKFKLEYQGQLRQVEHRLVPSSGGAWVVHRTD
ncbi:ribonuclease, Rne/Rng family [Thermanaerovibrio velox DSM 12556]|uniref:Ribonuclease, Rne/Rng family n=1 Tax=Thermanaerovibrio velox DSM 12556 TaxID=926567 RepID=H0UQH0_9BACT|nr:Rne/Rng family ribonuclease [Thermanaerovibrio velox]EHM09724.1 ribonuclease, Rne/Rng family [Thermanaerovibrio velox DSM 12556]